MAVLVFFCTFALFSLAGFLFPIDRQWYNRLQKPFFTPLDGFIGLVWIVLYSLISFTVTILYKTVGVIGLDSSWYFIFILNYLCNQAFSYFQFYRKNLFLAFMDCFAVALTTFLLILYTLPYSSLAAFLLLPYLLWTSFATFLAWRIYSLNK